MSKKTISSAPCVVTQREFHGVTDVARRLLARPNWTPRHFAVERQARMTRYQHCLIYDNLGELFWRRVAKLRGNERWKKLLTSRWRNLQARRISHANQSNNSGFMDTTIQIPAQVPRAHRRRRLRFRPTLSSSAKARFKFEVAPGSVMTRRLKSRSLKISASCGKLCGRCSSRRA